MTADQMCAHIVNLIYTPVYVYNRQGKLDYIVGKAVSEDGTVDVDLETIRTLLKKRNPEFPVLHIAEGNIIYGLVCDDTKDYVIGPCYLDSENSLNARYITRDYGVTLQRPYRSIRVTLDVFMQMVLMLYETIAERTIAPHEMVMNCFYDENSYQKLQAKLQEVSYNRKENVDIYNPYSQELREQEAIRKGDLDGLYRSIKETYVGKTGMLAQNPLRHAKNLSIVLVALACRSAIAGGLLPDVAFTMSDAYIQKIENLANVAETIAFGRQAEVEFCKAVHSSKNESRNKIIGQCKTHISQRLHTRITVNELAAEMNISPDYLSRLFIREEKMRITDFINMQKMEDAKKQLIYTDYSLDEIAQSLGYSSQSHFGQHFKKYVGMTPREYQKQYTLKGNY